VADSFVFWVHLVAATVWVGPQIFMFAVVVPALRATKDPAARYRAVVVLTQRFNVLAWAAMGLLVGTGVHNVIHEQDRHGQAFEYDLRYAWLLVAKLALVALAILLTIYHSYVVGPRLMAHQEAREEGPHVDALRRHSIVVSVANLLVALTILFVVTLLQNEDFSLHGV
jgi:uncharacterized membrane protein